ncbi:hypothetical protein Tco_0741388 [Tanacetum coccineum]
MKVYAFIIMLAICTLGLGPGCIFTLIAIAKWECSSYGRALALHAKGLEGYIDASCLSNAKDNSLKSGCVFLLGGGAISCDFKKQDCISISTMEYDHVALAATRSKVIGDNSSEGSTVQCSLISKSYIHYMRALQQACSSVSMMMSDWCSSLMQACLSWS